MTNLHKRLDTLEKHSSGTQGTSTIIIRYLSIKDEAELAGLRCGEARWKRAEGETERQLIDRASAEVQRNPWGIAVLFELADGEDGC